MERGEKIGLGVAGAGHVILFGLLSIGFLATPNPLKLKQDPVQVSLVEDVGLEAAAPQISQDSAQSIAPEQGMPEDAAPPAPAEMPPEPIAAPPRPAPKPAPVSKPKPPAPAEKAVAKPTRPMRPAATKGAGSTETAKAARPRGSRLGADFLKGLTDQPSKSTSNAPPAAKIGAQALADIGSAIQRQVQPCANRQVNPGPGAERIRVTINLRINRDGSLATQPRVVGRDGVDEGNRRYVDRVDDLAIATFVGCSPLRGLPDALYDVQNGWKNFTLRYKLPG